MEATQQAEKSETFEQAHGYRDKRTNRILVGCPWCKGAPRMYVANYKIHEKSKRHIRNLTAYI